MWMHCLAHGSYSVWLMVKLCISHADLMGMLCMLMVSSPVIPRSQLLFSTEKELILSNIWQG